MPAAAQHPARSGVSGGGRTGLPASTVWRILKRNGLNRLSWIDRPTGRVIRRYERSAPGELVHLDIKKVGKIPPGGGWRVHGRGSDRAKRANRSKRHPVGYTHLHVAIDDYSRVAYVEAHDNETAATLVGFWRRAQDWFWSNDMAVDEVSIPSPCVLMASGLMWTMLTAGLKPSSRISSRLAMQDPATQGPGTPSDQTGKRWAAVYDLRDGRIRSSFRPRGVTAMVVAARAAGDDGFGVGDR